jgi:hypothetical protein
MQSCTVTEFIAFTATIKQTRPHRYRFRKTLISFRISLNAPAEMAGNLTSKQLNLY